jgi:2',3'-cyclic-nucleotide 2'-phosphodiesterase (5'-nucleotidase family)
MDLKIQHFVIFITMVLFSACKEKPLTISEIEGKQLRIDSTLSPLDSFEVYIRPYRKRVEEVLDSTLTYAPKMITKEDGRYNTSAGNLLADIILSEANPVFKARTGNEIDFALMNHGGIRSIISKGKISARTAYEVMPFENSIAVVELSGTSITKLVEFLITSGRAHPIAGIQIILTQSGKLESVKIQGKQLDTNRKYYVATSDYLVSGGDNMVFFKDALTVTNINYLIRNAMIDYFKKVDTLKAAVDNRFIKIEN